MIKKTAIFIVLSVVCFRAIACDATKQWKELDDGYKSLMSVSDYSGAIKLAGEMLSLDPSSNKARFYLAYAHKKSDAPPPKWLFAERWSEGSAEDRFYKLLASDLANDS